MERQTFQVMAETVVHLLPLIGLVAVGYLGKSKKPNIQSHPISTFDKVNDSGRPGASAR